MEVLDQHDIWLEKKILKHQKWIQRLQIELNYLKETAKRTGMANKSTSIKKIQQLDLFAG